MLESEQFFDQHGSSSYHREHWQGLAPLDARGFNGRTSLLAAASIRRTRAVNIDM